MMGAVAILRKSLGRVTGGRYIAGPETRAQEMEKALLERRMEQATAVVVDRLRKDVRDELSEFTSANAIIAKLRKVRNSFLWVELLALVACVLFAGLTWCFFRVEVCLVMDTVAERGLTWTTLKWCVLGFMTALMALLLGSLLTYRDVRMRVSYEIRRLRDPED
jgi:hypothetical protein